MCISFIVFRKFQRFFENHEIIWISELSQFFWFVFGPCLVLFEVFFCSFSISFDHFLIFCWLFFMYIFDYFILCIFWRCFQLWWPWWQSEPFRFSLRTILILFWFFSGSFLVLFWFFLVLFWYLSYLLVFRFCNCWSFSENNSNKWNQSKMIWDSQIRSKMVQNGPKWLKYDTKVIYWHSIWSTSRKPYFFDCFYRVWYP